MKTITKSETTFQDILSFVSQNSQPMKNTFKKPPFPPINFIDATNDFTEKDQIDRDWEMRLRMNEIEKMDRIKSVAFWSALGLVMGLMALMAAFTYILFTYFL